MMIARKHSCFTNVVVGDWDWVGERAKSPNLEGGGETRLEDRRMTGNS